MASSNPTTNTAADQDSAAAAEARLLASQVGGHAGIETNGDGSLLMKPALPAETAFYQNLAQNKDFERLRPFLPKFIGTLQLQGKIDEATGNAVMAEVEGVHKDECGWLVFGLL
jgi:hypothetical protein